MYLPKSDILSILKNAVDCDVKQTSQYVFDTFPTITFELVENTVGLYLNNEIAYQNLIIKIDIWTESSSEGSNLLNVIEKAMRENYYILEYCSDIPNVDKDIFHISTRFKTIV